MRTRMLAVLEAVLAPELCRSRMALVISTYTAGPCWLCHQHMTGLAEWYPLRAGRCRSVGGQIGFAAAPLPKCHRHNTAAHLALLTPALSILQGPFQLRRGALKHPVRNLEVGLVGDQHLHSSHRFTVVRFTACAALPDRSV